jgi:hypothetical protein
MYSSHDVGAGLDLIKLHKRFMNSIDYFAELSETFVHRGETV